MGKIKILDESLSNMIAAGEVVENPASLVKELLENSLDAKSKYIKIDVKNGGKSITIIDDGVGMSKEDLLLCIERHATSKISSREDLFNLKSYGFRGEALAAISAVSKMNISSKQEKSEIGNSIYVSAGKITGLKENQRNGGTEIKITELFFNTPARLKFLRKDSTENARIKEIVLQESLANPDVSITLNIDEKQVLRTSGNGLENTIVEVFGVQILKSLKKTEIGYIGNPSLNRATRDYMFIFVNGRPVKAKVVEEAVIDAYYTYLMKGKYPFVIINLQVEPDSIDVNVHPSKKIIKFSNEKQIYHEVYNIINKSLLENSSFTMTGLKDENEEEIEDFEVRESKENDTRESILKFEKRSFFENDSEIKSNEQIEKNKKVDFIEKNSYSPLKTEKVELMLLEKNEKEKDISSPLKSENNYDILNRDEKKFSKIKIIGQFSNSYIITEEEGELLLYDQHIVHERILYEKLKKEYEGKKIISQSLLVPIRVTVIPKQYDLFKKNISLFQDFGFEIDEFSESELLIRAVPNFETKDSFENIFFEILSGIDKLNSKNEVIESFIISLSCRGAIKANQKLDIFEMESLLSQLHRIGKFSCPHGRPIIFRLGLNEIEKGFKRK